jgi:tetratricopeptide (TPR) repeat protein
LQIFLAVALVNSGQREPGLVAMKNNYKIIQDGVAAGSISQDEWNTWYTGLASCFDKNPKEAEAFVATVVGEKPMEYWNYIGIATLYMVQGESGTPEAVKMLEKSAEVAKASGVKDSNQQQAAALLQAGNLLYASKNFSKSMELFEQAIQLIPDNAGALNNAAYLIAKSGTNPARAVELARKSVELNAAGIDDFLDTLGFALLRAGKASEAIEPLQKAIVIGQKPASMIHLAEVFIELKRPLDAKEFLEKAKKQKPTDEQLEEIKALELKLN